jgi:hypothetical protein
MMFATDPKIVKLPAKVVAKAVVVHAKVGSGRDWMKGWPKRIKGTLLTTWQPSVKIAVKEAVAAYGFCGIQGLVASRADSANPVLW